jgi:NMD protein affecting ribosome stability and mRNA decay
MIRYCPTCSRSNKEARFIGEFCEPCIIEKISKDFPTYTRVEYCKRCERIKLPIGYVKNDAENMGVLLAKLLCNSKCKIKIKSYDEKSAMVEVTYPVGDYDHVNFDKQITIKMMHMICQECYRKSSGYYEAIIQLRGPRQKVEPMLKKVTKYLTERGAFIAKTEEVETGIDIYVSDKLLAKSFFAYSKLVPKASYTLYSIRKGKEIYRHTYLLRL